MTYEHLSLQFENGVGQLKLDRPKKRNALSLDILEELITACEEIKKHSKTRIVVLQGNGASFSVGFDLTTMASFISEGKMPDAATLKEWALLGQRAVDALANLPVITIASVQGHAIGGGFLLMTACDFRLAAEDTVFSLPEVEIGLPLTWGGVPRVTQELGPALSKDLILTCRSFGPKDLDKTNFLYGSVPAAQREKATQDLVTCLKNKPPLPLLQSKAQFLEAATTQGFNSNLDAERFAQALLDPNFLPTAMAYVQRLREKP